MHKNDQKGKREMKMKDKAFLSSLLRSIAPNSLPGLLCLISQHIQIHSDMQQDAYGVVNYFFIRNQGYGDWGRWDVVSPITANLILPFCVLV